MKDQPRLNFEGALAKLTIGSIDDSKLTCRADYNPKELQISKSLSWKDHNEGDKDVKKGKTKGKSEQDSVEMTGVPKRTMSIELLFDGYETGQSVAERLEVLETLSSASVPTSRKEDQRRPHYCVVVWGQKGVPAFRCVIDKLDIKYTMFDRQGTPLRATATLSLQEANLKSSGSFDDAKTAAYKAGTYSDDKRAMTVIDAPLDEPAGRQPKSVGSSPAAGPSAAPPPPPPPTPPRKPLTQQEMRQITSDPSDPKPLSKQEVREITSDPSDPAPPPTVFGPQPAPLPPGQGAPPSPERSREAMEDFREVNGDQGRGAPPSPERSREAMEDFREVNGDQGRGAPPSPERSREAMEDFREVNGDPPKKDVPKDILDDLA